VVLDDTVIARIFYKFTKSRKNLNEHFNGLFMVIIEIIPLENSKRPNYKLEYSIFIERLTIL